MRSLSRSTRSDQMPQASRRCLPCALAAGISSNKRTSLRALVPNLYRISAVNSAPKVEPSLGLFITNAESPQSGCVQSSILRRLIPAVLKEQRELDESLSVGQIP